MKHPGCTLYYNIYTLSWGKISAKKKIKINNNKNLNDRESCIFTPWYGSLKIYIEIIGHFKGNKKKRYPADTDDGSWSSDIIVWYYYNYELLSESSLHENSYSTAFISTYNKNV